MFILDQNAFGDARLDNIEEFVKCWSRFYQDKEQISYLDELHLGGDLTKENVRKLLRWKDRQFLTHSNKRGAPNPKVQKVLDKIETINSFRRQEIPESDFCDFARGIFPSGPVYRPFLFHIARPADYPIWDQHVARVHALLTKRSNNGDWRHYNDYRSWFTELKTLLKIGHDSTRADIQKAKRLDSALLAYGQFLERYRSNVDVQSRGAKRQRNKFSPAVP